MLRLLLHAFAVVILTLLTQMGGLAWLVSRAFRRKIFVFLLVYAALSLGAAGLAPVFGRQALPCVEQDGLAMHSPLFCVLNRHYVVPEMASVLEDTADRMMASHPGTRLRVLDAGFPFLDGFPLLPHLSHDDERKADLAFLYRSPEGSVTSATPSPVGYLAFEEGPTGCPPAWPTLRWDLGWLQGLWPPLALDETRTGDLVRTLAADPRVGRLFLEPHLQDRLGVTGPKVRFQGCRAARHDDHMHVEL